MTRIEALRQVTAQLTEIYGEPFTLGMIAMWDRVLAPYSAEDILCAFDEHLRDASYKHFKILPAILTKHLATRNGNAEMAFSVVEAATRQVPSRSGIAFEDPLIHSTLHALGGWEAAFYDITNRDKCEHFRDKFCKTYERLSLGAPRPHPAYLPGRANDGCYSIVGDEAAVDRVVSSGYDPVRPAVSNYLPKLGEQKRLAPPSDSAGK